MTQAMNKVRGDWMGNAMHKGSVLVEGVTPQAPKSKIVNRLACQCRGSAGLPVRMYGCEHYGPSPTFW